MQPLVLAGTAFGTTVMLISALRVVAPSIGLVDQPGGHKRHSGRVPVVGGIAMFLGVVCAAGLGTRMLLELEPVFAAAAFLLVVGAVDDRFRLRAWTRLGAQTGAVLVMMLATGLYLEDIGAPFGAGRAELGLAALPLSVVIAVTVVNAFNFIDGLDGLAASMALIALGAVVVVAGVGTPAAALATVTCGAILGFLVFNFPGFRVRRFRTFMGDAGSTVLGFLVVTATVTISQGEARLVSPVPALWFALVPLADFFSCFVRRIRRGRSPLAPGRDHFHHVLLRAGFSSRQVLAVLAGLALVYAAIGLLGARAGWPDWPLFAAWIGLLAGQYFVIRRLACLARRRRWRRLQACASNEPAAAVERAAPSA